jgi:hypothetical protein
MKSSKHILMEYVPQGENLGNWTRLVTIQAYRGLGASSEPTAAIARRAFYPITCDRGPLYQDGGERVMPGGLKQAIIAIGCASPPAGAYPQAMKGAGEQDFIAIFTDFGTDGTIGNCCAIARAW